MSNDRQIIWSVARSEAPRRFGRRNFWNGSAGCSSESGIGASLGRRISNAMLSAILVLCCLLLSLGTAVGAPHKKVMVLGIDGMDPKLLQTFVDQGRMPNF